MRVALTLMLALPVSALAAIETYGIQTVPEGQIEVLYKCNYLGIVEGKSFWGGAYKKDISIEGTTKRLYKNANKKGATHLVLAEDIEYAGWGTVRKGKAYTCLSGQKSTPAKNPGGINQQHSEVANSTINAVGQLRAVSEANKDKCGFIKSIMKGAGGPDNSSTYVEKAMEQALSEATSVGADSYYIVDVETSMSGASVMLEALKCN